ncbi:MAG: DinB family protein [Phycisphaerales bacterium JB039]
MLSLADITAILRATPGTLDAMLGSLPEDVAGANYGAGTFSPYNVVGHLIIGEREDWIPRARIILERGTGRPFDPFPHDGTIGPESGRTLRSLLDEFARLRRENLGALAALALTAEDLARRGTHPALGEVTLGQLLATWAAHDLHHTAQVAKGLSYQLREQVGPWREYIGLLRGDQRVSQ